MSGNTIQNNMKCSLVLLKSSKCAAVRILGFPYAGGNATFVRNWSEHLPSYVELFGVNYSGRNGRTSGPLLLTPQAIVEDLIEDVIKCATIPVILFGYSLGAVIAYETSKQLAQRGLSWPSELVVAAARAPHLPRKSHPVSSLSDTEFIAKLRSYGGTPEAVLQDKQLLDYYLPILRADFATAENYQLLHFTPLPCPITAIAGSSDNSADASMVAAWEKHTSGTFDLHQLEGSHFFLHKQLNSVLEIMRRLARRHVNDELAADLALR